MTEEKISEICKALGDANRLNIIKFLTTGEKCACNILEGFNFSQPTLSHHMKILTSAGLVESRKDGKWTYYSICFEQLKELSDFFAETACGPENKICE